MPSCIASLKPLSWMVLIHTIISVTSLWNCQRSIGIREGSNNRILIRYFPGHLNFRKYVTNLSVAEKRRSSYPLAGGLTFTQELFLMLVLRPEWLKLNYLKKQVSARQISADWKKEQEIPVLLCWRDLLKQWTLLSGLNLSPKRRHGSWLLNLIRKSTHSDVFW